MLSRALSLSSVFAVAVLVRSQEPAAMPMPSQPLGQGASATIANSFATAETWALQAMALLSLGNDWHPVGAVALLAALRSKDARLAVFGIEQLRRTDDRAQASVCTKEILGELIGTQLAAKNELVRERTLTLLQRIVPTAGASNAVGWQQWWAAQQDSYVVPAWTPAGNDGKVGTVSGALVERAFDLRDTGLQVAFIVDSTGSMQLAIDAVGDAVTEITAILGGIAPKLELGLVHYKDFGDMSAGAAMLVPLTKDQKKVRDKLAGLRAAGGGDIPERVEKGIEVALDKAMGWKKETNRLLLVVGDAPPHPEDQPALLELVQAAHDRPFRHGKKPTTGKAESLRPFITSTIATDKKANPWFEEIAAAGGGTCVLLDLDGARRKVDGKAVGKLPATPPELVAKHVLQLSFGKELQAQSDLFVDTFFEYRRAGAF